jgi:peptide/nickel transport system permease protein
MRQKYNRSIIVGSILLAILILAATIGVFLPEHPNTNLSQAMARPSLQHWLGCDAFGVDLSLRILAGAAQTLRIGVLVSTLTLIIGFTVGTFSTLAPPKIEALILRLIDSFMAFPGLLLAILVASIMPHSESTIIFALAVTGWTSRARFCRSFSKQVLKTPYIEAAKAGGAGTYRIIRYHIWPALSGQLLVQVALSMSSALIAEASLSFLGFGSGFDNPSWGKLIAEGREYLIEAPHLSLAPGAAFVLSVFAFNLISEGMRKKLDPSSRVGLY